MNNGAIFLYLAAGAQLALSIMEWWRAENHDRKVRFFVTAVLQVVVFALACGVIWQNTTEFAEARADASTSRARLIDVQARLADVQETFSQAQAQVERLSGQNQDLQARNIQLVGISKMIAQGCISNPKLRKKAEQLGAHFERNARESLHVTDKVTVDVQNRGKGSAQAPKK